MRHTDVQFIESIFGSCFSTNSNYLHICFDHLGSIQRQPLRLPSLQSQISNYESHSGQQQHRKLLQAEADFAERRYHQLRSLLQRRTVLRRSDDRSLREQQRLPRRHTAGARSRAVHVGQHRHRGDDRRPTQRRQVEGSVFSVRVPERKLRSFVCQELQDCSACVR